MKKVTSTVLAYMLASGAEVEVKPKMRKLIPTDREMPRPEKKGTKPKGKCKKHNKKKRGW